MEQKEKPLTRAQELRKNATKEENHLWYDFCGLIRSNFSGKNHLAPIL